MASSSGFVLTHNDIHGILKTLYECRMARIDQLQVATGRSYYALYYRLQNLIRAGYVATPFPKHISQKIVYSLGNSAPALLVSEGIAPPSFLDSRLRLRELREVFLPHTLAIVDAHVIILSAIKGTPLTIAEWRHEHELHDTVTVYVNRQPVSYPVRPDAWAVFEDTSRGDPDRFYPLILEIDRHTMSLARVAEKYKAYWHYLNQGKHATRFGYQQTPSVLTIAKTPERSWHLKEAAESVMPRDGRGWYLFSSFEHFSSQEPQNIFKEIYVGAHSRNLRSLLPHLAEASPAT